MKLSMVCGPLLQSNVSGTAQVQAMEDLLNSCDQIITLLKENLQAAQERMKHDEVPI